MAEFRFPPGLRPALCGAALALASAAAMPAAMAEKQTVCTITVSSPNEQEVFRRYLPASKYRFVELVQRGRPDWLGAACQAAVSCDVLVVSAHFDGDDQFYTERLDESENLTVSELERASCSNSCPALFSRLKEVYLFGCNTLNPKAQSDAPAQIVRSLVGDGHTRQDAQRLLHSLTANHGQSSAERMREVFKDVPVIYGFSSVAPLGPVSAPILDRYFRTTGTREIGSGRPSRRLLDQYASHSMSVIQGITPSDPHFQARQDMCRFTDERLSDADKLAFVHEILQRHVGEARLYLSRIQRFIATLDGPAQQKLAVARVLDEIANDRDARGRFLDFAREAEEPAVRVRMLDLARDLGWLSEGDRQQEVALMLGELLSRREAGVAEVNLACTLNARHDLDSALDGRAAPGGAVDDVAHAAMRACLGSDEGRQRTLAALLSPREAEVQIAQAFLRQRPITDTGELRQLALDIARMPASEAQVRALEALGRHYLSDREIVELLRQLFAQTSSASVQSAVAGILLRAERRSITSAQLLRTLREYRLSPPTGGDAVDALILRLQTS